MYLLTHIYIYIFIYIYVMYIYIYVPMTNVCKQICSPMPTVYSIANMYMNCVCARFTYDMCKNCMRIYIYMYVM